MWWGVCWLTEVFALLNSHLNANLATGSCGQRDNNCVNNQMPFSAADLNSRRVSEEGIFALSKPRYDPMKNLLLLKEVKDITFPVGHNVCEDLVLGDWTFFLLKSPIWTDLESL